MNTNNKLMQTRLNAMKEDLKQIFELLLSVYTEKEFITRMLLMKEKENNAKK